ncbi:MAG TPA: homocysteine S-methyltransferase [Vicinamibacteria bacterium]|nr:homocysteine S-methyltransferase [Vicinamibacteria bacterium]
MGNPLAQFLDAQRFVILDGGLATELERRGADLHDPLWSAKLLLDAPEMLEELHYDYFAAGADVGTSASYQASFEGFGARGIDESGAEHLLRLSVDLVRRARERFWSDERNRAGRIAPLVAASVGCYGAILHDGSEYRGDYGLSRAELRTFHERRLRVLEDSGADIIACETVPCRLEAEALVSLLEAPAWISFSCRNEREVCHGEQFAECVRLVSRASAVVAVGMNCTHPRYVSSLLAIGASDKPSLCYPNSGEVWDADRKEWTGSADSSSIAELARTWYRLGARLIGGCCRTKPETISAIRRALTEQVVTQDAPHRP